MKLRRVLTCLPLLALMTIPSAADAWDGHGKNHRYRANDSVEWRNRSDRYDYYRDQYPQPRATRGHRPHDNNGDGVVSRREWPGNSNSFRQLDRNRDGVLSEADRRMQRRDDRYYEWQRRDNRNYRYR